MIHERRLGRTGLSVSEVGYGAWGIGGDMWLGAQDDESLAALNRAIDLGLNFIDTALAYGRGHSEQLVGQVVRVARGADRRLEQDPAEEPALAGPGRDRSRRGLPGGLGAQVHRADALQPRHGRARHPAVPRLERRLARPRHVAAGDRGAQGRGQDPLLRRLDQRPPARQRGQADRDRRRGHRPGHLQRLRAGSRGRALRRLRGLRRRRDRARPVRRGQPDRAASRRTRRSRTATSATSTSRASARWRTSTSACRRSSTTSGSRARSCPRSRCATCSAGPRSRP